MKTIRWQDFTETVIGIWLLSSPIVLGFIRGPAGPELWNAFIVGTTITLLAAEAIKAPAAWEELVNIFLGLWMVSSPWVLNYAEHARATLNAVGVGCAIIALATWATLIDRGYQRWYRRTIHS